MAAKAFAEDEFGVRDVERRVEGCPGGVLEAMLGPEGLGAIRDGDGFKGLFAWMVGGERDMRGGMPVLGEDYVVEFFGQGVNDRDHSIAFSDG